MRVKSLGLVVDELAGQQAPDRDDRSRGGSVGVGVTRVQGLKIRVQDKPPVDPNP
jgi:hypothetical protein